MKIQCIIKDKVTKDMVKTKYKNAYYCVNEISNFIYRKYKYELSDEEKLYLTIHIERVVYKTKT